MKPSSPPAPPLEAVRLERARRNCSYFIEGFVRIKDEDSGTVVPFVLWPEQVRALTAFLAHRWVLVLKARQLGLTWLALAYALWRLLFQPGYSALALSKSDAEAKKLIERLKLMLQHLPVWMVRPSAGAPAEWLGATWDGTTHTIAIHHRNPETGEHLLDSTAEALAAGPEAGRSFTVSLLLLDEWAFQVWARQIWSAAFPTVNRPDGGQVIGLSSMKLGTLFAELCRKALDKIGEFVLVFLAWTADPRRTASWYEATKRALPDSYRQEYPATVEEAFEGRTGRVMPEYGTEIHYIDGPQDLFDHPDLFEWAWYGDPAPDAPTCWTLWAFARGGPCYAVAEVYSPGGRVSEIVAECWAVQQRIHCTARYRMIDPAAQAKKSDGQASDYQLYREAWHKYDAAALRLANNARGIERLRERLVVTIDPEGRSSAGLYVCRPGERTPGCPNLHMQMRDLTWKPQRPDGSWPEDWAGDDHAFDTARYMSNDRPERYGANATGFLPGAQQRRRRVEDDDDDDNDDRRRGFFAR